MPDDAVDPSVLTSLTERLGERAGGFRDSLIETWCTETDRRLVELDQAVSAADAGALGRVAHAMKSGSAALGARGLAALCQELEDATPTGAVDLGRARTRLRAEAARARAGLEALSGH
ncbi:MAG: hypothetical protein NVSMB55_25540 [Mycobacteriales bacterium]